MKKNSARISNKQSLVDARYADLLATTAVRKIVSRPWSKRAAVSIVIDSDRLTGSSVLMIQRAKHKADPWSGDMAFPGGRHEKIDGSTLRTAQRETREELGFNLDTASDVSHSALVGRLSDRRATRRGASLGLVVTPYVFNVLERPALLPNYEVANTVWVPLEYLADFANRKAFAFRYAGMSMSMPCYQLSQEQKIWGLSLNMIDELLRIAGLNIPATRELESL